MTAGGAEPEATSGSATGPGPDDAPDETEEPRGGDREDHEDDDDGFLPDWGREELQQSAVAGVAAYLVGYGLLYLWFLTDGRLVGNEFTDWRWVGWIFYHGQFVPLDASAGGTSPAAAGLVESQLGALENVVPALLLSAIAVGTAGFLLARDRATVDPELAAKTGASLVVGYLPLAILGVVAFAGTLPNGIHVRPSPIWAPIVAGVVFPGVVGALGALGYVYWERRDAEESDGPLEDEPHGDEPHENEPPTAETPEGETTDAEATGTRSDDD